MACVVVTGAGGFVGTRLCRMLAERGHPVRALLREGRAVPAGVAEVCRGTLEDPSALRRAVEGADAVVHLAARVHVMRDRSPDPLESFRQVNVEGSRRLAEAASAAGVRRFVFVSSIKVNGELSPQRPFTEADAPRPEDAYGLSKWEAEQAIRSVGAATRLEVTVVRPPLVYGPGVGGNMLRLLRLVYRGVPLPLGAVATRRSFVGVTNLCDLLLGCTVHPAAAQELFLASDQNDLSTADLVRRLAAGLGRPARLLSVPLPTLECAARMVGAQAAYDRLCGPLQVDSAKASRVLGWSPPETLDSELRRMTESFLRCGPK